MNVKEILFSFKGRINRAKFLIYMFFIQLLFIMFVFLIYYFYKYNLSIVSEILSIVASIFGIWTSLALYIKRWHDLDKSGWWILLIFIPIINLLVFIYLSIKKGTEGSNRFGKDPLNIQNG